MDDFGVKYVDEENALHLINSLKEDFTISEDWRGGVKMRNQSQIGLRQAHISYIHIKVYPKTITKVQTSASH